MTGEIKGLEALNALLERLYQEDPEPTLFEWAGLVKHWEEKDVINETEQ